MKFIAILVIASCSFAYSQTTKPTTNPAAAYPALQTRMIQLEKEVAALEKFNAELKSQIADLKAKLRDYETKKTVEAPKEKPNPVVGSKIADFVNSIDPRLHYYVISENGLHSRVIITYSETATTKITESTWGIATVDKDTGIVLEYTKN